MVCAAALEVQRIVIEQDLLANVRQMGIYLERALRRTFKNHPYVGDIRGRGLFWGVRTILISLSSANILSSNSSTTEQLKRHSPPPSV